MKNSKIQTLLSKDINILFLANQYDALSDTNAIQEKVGGDFLCQLSQIHSDHIVEITTENCQQSLEGDAMITDTPGLALLIKTADCQALLLYDPLQKAIAAIHAGWKGLIQDIIPKTIQKMSDLYGSKPADLIAVFIPSLLSCCSEFSDPSHEIPQIYHDFILQNNHVDLAGIADQQLIEAGVKPENVDRMPGCTMCDSDKYFSFRRGDAKRMGSVIMLQK